MSVLHKDNDNKFLMECTYHHCKERIIPTPNCVLDPLGLPILLVSSILFSFIFSLWNWKYTIHLIFLWCWQCLMCFKCYLVAWHCMFLCILSGRSVIVLIYLFLLLKYSYLCECSLNVTLFHGILCFYPFCVD